MRRRASLLAGVALAATLTGCTELVQGTARPVAVPPPASTTAPEGMDPCSLLTDAEAKGLGLSAGRFQKAKPEQLVPPSCDYKPLDTSSPFMPITIGVSSDIAVAEYFQTPQPDYEAEFGGLTWGHYENTFGAGFCDFAYELGKLSFVAVLGGNLTEKDKACDLVKQVLPLIAAKLPK